MRHDFRWPGLVRAIGSDHRLRGDPYAMTESAHVPEYDSTGGASLLETAKLRAVVNLGAMVEYLDLNSTELSSGRANAD